MGGAWGTQMVHSLLLKCGARGNVPDVFAVTGDPMALVHLSHRVPATELFPCGQALFPKLHLGNDELPTLSMVDC